MLAVDDTATNREIVDAYLRAGGHDSTAVGSGADALAVLQAAAAAGEPFDVVVLDGQMPGMDGFELAAAICDDPALADVRLVMLASTGDHRARAREVGIPTYLTKPVRRERLLEAVADASCRDELVAPAPATPALASEVRVLIAEDNAVNQLVIETMLTKRGFAVDIANDGVEALARLATGSYGAVFMDCQMPNLDGYSTTARIREREGAGERLPVIAMTAHAMKGDRERCLEAGMDDYMSKPLRPDVLDEVLERWLGVKPAVRAETSAQPAIDALIDDARMRIVPRRLRGHRRPAARPVPDQHAAAARRAARGRRGGRRGGAPAHRAQAQGQLPEHRRHLHGDAVPDDRDRRRRSRRDGRGARRCARADRDRDPPGAGRLTPRFMRTCVRMSSQGSPYARFQRALRIGRLPLVRAAAAELPRIDLDDALAICLLIEDQDAERFERAAVRWLARLSLEVPTVRIEDLRAGLLAFEALPENPHGAPRWRWRGRLRGCEPSARAAPRGAGDWRDRLSASSQPTLAP